MKWGIFAVVLLICLAIDTSLIAIFQIELLGGMVKPSALALLALFVSLWAPKGTALWACVLIGIFVDASSPIASRVYFGPHIVGFAFAGLLMAYLRGIVMRRELFAFVCLSVIFTLALSIVVVAVLTIRSWYPNELGQWSPLSELGRRALSSIYTGLFAVPFGWLLMKTSRLWAFHVSASARVSWRS